MISILSVFLFQFTLPLISGLIVAGDDMAKLEKLPEYSEFLGRMKGKNYTISSNSERNTREIIQQNSPMSNHPFVQFPTLCQKAPQEGDFYGHVFCWAAFSLYALLILSLIIYQLRSFLWFNFKIRDKNGDRFNQQNIELESAHSPKLSRMLSKRPDPNTSTIPLIVSAQSRPPQI